MATLPVLGYDTTEQYALKKYIFEQAEVLQKCREELGQVDSATMMTPSKIFAICLPDNFIMELSNLLRFHYEGKS